MEYSFDPNLMWSSDETYSYESQITWLDEDAHPCSQEVRDLIERKMREAAESFLKEVEDVAARLAERGIETMSASEIQDTVFSVESMQSVIEETQVHVGTFRFDGLMWSWSADDEDQEVDYAQEIDGNESYTIDEAHAALKRFREGRG